MRVDACSRGAYRLTCHSPVQFWIFQLPPPDELVVIFPQNRPLDPDEVKRPDTLPSASIRPFPMGSYIVPLLMRMVTLRVGARRPSQEPVDTEVHDPS